MNKILRLPAVMQRTGLSRATVYRLARTGQFPSPIKLSERASGWLEMEVDSWLADHAGERCVDKPPTEHHLASVISTTSLTPLKLFTESEIVASGISLNESVCAVYFLISNGRIVYVGQSINIHSRIATHQHRKSSDSYAFICCEPAQLDVLESIYIHALRPPLNVGANGNPRMPRSLTQLLAMRQ